MGVVEIESRCETEQDSPLLDLYRVAEQVVLKRFRNKRCWPVWTRGWNAEGTSIRDHYHPNAVDESEARAEDEDVDEPTPENHEEINDEMKNHRALPALSKSV